ncbi:MAG: right-handed parallel beta-helix repeat-containing protein, partial [Phaeodactylibacter sp.]|nr:right-handed parallel beta-helix repeat-containing protein [Phaeodactylibacter sp.]
MKSVIYPIVCLLFALGLNGQTTYVNSNANGSNDGSSWANAYTSLHDALQNTAEGSIWVAAGTYLTGTDTAGVFSISAPLSVYGGFAGTESSPEERDLAQNETLLSADIAGNDDGDFLSATRDDNSSHILYVDSLLSAPVVIDGFTIKGAQANLATSDASDYEWRGGGIYALSTVEVTNCLFTENAARSGGSVLIFGANTQFSTVTNSQFINNYTNNQAAGILADGTSGVRVEDCTFENNTTVRGCIYPLFSDGFEIRNCTFENNTNEEGTSAGIFAWQPTNLIIEGCTFRNNLASSSTCMYIDQRDLSSDDPNALIHIEDCVFEENDNPGGFSAGLYFWQPKKLEIISSDFLNQEAANASGIYIDQRDVTPDINSVLIDSCLFQGNISTDYGGSGIYFWNTNFTVANSQFVNNSAPNTASAIYMGGDEDDGVINNCTFTGNGASFAGAIANYNSLGNLVIQGSTFNGNSAGNGGGAISAGFLGKVFTENCVFQNNESGYGGAIFVQNDSSEFSALNTNFIGNVTNNTSGGAILNNSSNPITVDGCYFELNTSNTVGGAVSVLEDSLDLSVLTLRNSIFNFNIAGTQGGALNISNVDATIESCVFTNNNALEDGIGGAISLNASTGGESD